MNIVVISNYRGQHIARPEAEIFISLQQRGFHVTIFTFEDAGYIERFLTNGLEVIPHHPEGKRDRAFAKRLKTYLTENKVDVVHAFNGPAIYVSTKVLKSFKAIKLVAYRGASANMAWFNPKNYLKFYHPRIDLIVCNSQEIADIYNRNPLVGANKAIVIHKGHDPSWYQDVQERNLRHELNLSKDTVLVVFVANHRKVKGARILVKAIEQLPSDTLLRFVFVGKKLDQFIRNGRPNHDKIIHWGYCPDVLPLIKGCDVSVCPSIGSESLSKSIVESMSLGVPAVISDIPGNKVLLDDGVNGWVFRNRDSRQLAERLINVGKYPAQLKKVGLLAQKKIADALHIETTVAKYEQAYRQLLDHQ
jgi:glycosyltransferase involved in cell wall biosynthesis